MQYSDAYSCSGLTSYQLYVKCFDLFSNISFIRYTKMFLAFKSQNETIKKGSWTSYYGLTFRVYVMCMLDQRRHIISHRSDVRRMLMVICPDINLHKNTKTCTCNCMTIYVLLNSCLVYLKKCVNHHFICIKIIWPNQSTKLFSVASLL